MHQGMPGRSDRAEGGQGEEEGCGKLYILQGLHDMCHGMPAQGNRKGEGEMNSVIVYITAKDAGEAGKISEALVREKLAACANIIPEIKSIYRWKGKIERDNETVLIVKTKEDLVQRVIKRVKELHSYDVHCVNVVPITEGNQDYFEWIEESLK